MKLLIDTNIILDQLLDRKPFSNESNILFKMAEDKEAYEYVSASAMTDIYYLVQKELKDTYETQRKIEDLLSLISILDVNNDDIREALNLHWNDFEDAVQYIVAKRNNVDYIITRNVKDFENCEIPVVTPVEFLEFNYRR